MRRALLGMLLAASLAAPAAAADLVGKASEAQNLADQGKFIEAMAALDAATDALWEQAPLTFRRVLWVAGPPEGFGVYNARETNVYASGDQMIVYAEPVGFGWDQTGDIYQMNLAIDLVIKSKDGEELLRKDDFQKLSIGSRVRNREFMATLTLTLTGIPAGEYIADATLRDVVTGKKGTMSLPFVIKG
jgi:opacity protein-like surface antigen